MNLLALLLLAAPAAAPAPVKAPGDIIAEAPAGDWVAIAPDDLLVMDLAPDAQGRPRRVVIQLMPAPFSPGWIANIRTLATAHWWDGTSINRAQDNYVVQWGDADGEDKAKAKPLPAGLKAVPQSAYTTPYAPPAKGVRITGSPYSQVDTFYRGWPIGLRNGTAAPAHCYGMVGVGRDLPPDTGSGAELYVVIGHAPRQLDRNIALVGRVIDGIENLSTLPRGTEPLSFYKTAAERVPILRTRLAGALPVAEQPRFEYLSTDSASFARLSAARSSRRDAFFIAPVGGADLCNLAVPIRPARSAR
jgi:peptidylprolyl isomerase